MTAIDDTSDLGDRRPGDRSERFELFIAVVLGIATVLTSYGAMRSSIVGDQVLEGFTNSSQFYAEASAIDDQNTQTYVSDQNLFVRYAEATFENDDDLASYLRSSLFSDELETAMVWWEGQQRLADPPESPFEEGSPYKFATDPQSLIDQADESYDDARRADARTDRFDQATAILSITLFTGAVATLIRSRAARNAFVGLALSGLATGVMVILLGETG